MMHVPSVMRTATCSGARACPIADPSSLQTAVLMSLMMEPPIPSGRKSSGCRAAPGPGASPSTFGTSASRLASRKAIASW